MLSPSPLPSLLPLLLSCTTQRGGGGRRGHCPCHHCHCNCRCYCCCRCCPCCRCHCWPVPCHRGSRCCFGALWRFEAPGAEERSPSTAQSCLVVVVPVPPTSFSWHPPRCCPCPAAIVVVAAPHVIVVGRSRAAVEVVPALGHCGQMRGVPEPPNRASATSSLTSLSRQRCCHGPPPRCCPHPATNIIVAAPRVVVPVSLPSSSWPPPALPSLSPLSSSLPAVHPCPQTLLKASNNTRATPIFADCCVATKIWVGYLSPG